MSALLLAVETSCDETAAAVVRDDLTILGEAVASQVDLHRQFGGVVPEIASRSHQEVINMVIDEVLAQAGLSINEVDAIAATQGPGLPGALMIGFATAKAIAYALRKPLIGVNHLEGHIYANLFEHPDLRPPFVALVVSGGHTFLVHVRQWGDYRILGQTLDDAAGEAFDKVAGFLGLGYPGGPAIEKAAESGDPNAIAFPRAMMKGNNYDFSLSGLKTAVLYYVTKEKAAGAAVNIADVAAGFQAAVIDVQVKKTMRAARETGVEQLVLAGGVAANASLRDQLAQSAQTNKLILTYPSLKYCTDNAAMIAAAAWPKYRQGRFLGIDAQTDPNLALT